MNFPSFRLEPSRSETSPVDKRAEIKVPGLCNYARYNKLKKPSCLRLLKYYNSYKATSLTNNGGASFVVDDPSVEKH